MEPSLPYRHRVEQQVAFRDIDYFHHANNAAYSTWTETARLAYLRDVCGVDSLERMSIVLGEIQIRFVSSARYAETVTVWTRASRLGTKSFDLDHRIDGPDGRLIALVKTTQVCYDHQAGHSIALPDEWRRQIEEFEGFEGFEEAEGT